LVETPSVGLDKPRTGRRREDVRVPIKGLRRAVAEKLVVSRHEIPDVTVWVDLDAGGLLQARAEINRCEDPPVGVLALVARICIIGLQHFPELNARVDNQAQEIVQSAAIHLGIAVQADRGLLVPVVRDADTMTLRQLAAAIRTVTTKGRRGTLTPDELTGGTFTVNNYGVFGVDGSTPIINHPEAAIVGLGRIVDKPWVVDGELAVRKVTQLVLAFDHRVCDGGVAGGFLRYVADCLERPTRLLADL
jgi:pyruvate dehydrogenase E2 component (dihydrolipoamide acetyltransferase)